MYLIIILHISVHLYNRFALKVCSYFLYIYEVVYLPDSVTYDSNATSREAPLYIPNINCLDSSTYMILSLKSSSK